MGKAQKILDIAIHPSLAKWPVWEELREKGHTVEVVELNFFDVFLGPNCWRMDEFLRKYLDVALDSAKEKRYPKVGLGKGVAKT